MFDGVGKYIKLKRNMQHYILRVSSFILIMSYYTRFVMISRVIKDVFVLGTSVNARYPRSELPSANRA